MTAEIIDQANELAEQRLQLTIQAHRLNRNAVSAEHCIECGDPIDERRRAAVAGCQTCASCQSDLELRNKQCWGV